MLHCWQNSVEKGHDDRAGPRTGEESALSRLHDYQDRGADGQISGALSTTGDTLRPALQIIKCAPGISCVSGGMILVSKAKEYGENGVIVMGDVAVTQTRQPSSLLRLLIARQRPPRGVAGFAEPRVAMLSFSTKGSAKDAIDKATGKSVYIIDKVTDATKLAHENYPDLHVDGELQQMQPSFHRLVAKKLQASSIAGKANVLYRSESGSGQHRLLNWFSASATPSPSVRSSQGIARPVNGESRMLRG